METSITMQSCVRFKGGGGGGGGNFLVYIFPFQKISGLIPSGLFMCSLWISFLKKQFACLPKILQNFSFVVYVLIMNLFLKKIWLFHFFSFLHVCLCAQYESLLIFDVFLIFFFYKRLFMCSLWISFTILRTRTYTHAPTHTHTHTHGCRV